MPATTSPDIDSIARRLAVLLSELAGPQPVVPPDLPEYIQDPDARRRMYGNCDRATYWRLCKQPDFPTLYKIGGLRLRKTADHIRYLAARAVD